MTPSDAKLLAALADAEARATKGPFHALISDQHKPYVRFGLYAPPKADREDWDMGPELIDGREMDGVWVGYDSVGPNEDDLKLLALARNAIPRLIELVKAQDAALRHAAVVACAPSARIGVPMADALSGLRKALDELVPGWNDYGLAALGVTKAVTP